MVLINKDKYLKDGVDVEELFNDLKSYNDKIKGVTNYYARDLSIKFLKEFLSQPVKPTLTEDEKVILRNIREKKKYIKRFGEYDLVVYDEVEADGTTRTYKSGAFGLEPFSHLFQFIKPRRRI